MSAPSLIIWALATCAMACVVLLAAPRLRVKGLSFVLYAQAALGAGAIAWPTALPQSTPTLTHALGLADSSFLSWSLHFDVLSVSMFALVALLGAVLVAYSQSYLKAERKGAGFVRQIGVSVLLVQGFVLSNHLVLHAVLWLGISVSVHRLLRHYDGRARARLSARKKFLMSRVGDLCFAGALAVLYFSTGTLELQSLNALAASASPAQSEAMSWAAWGLCGAAILKSAQVPFHAWLPETMEAPTPVSALMHAGVVNAGAFLLLRMTPVLQHGASALTGLIVVGGVTVAIGLLVQAVQPSIKISLAWSTIAQMGFLFFELGLGLTAAAWLHLVAHAAYKAHAFLRSGDVELIEHEAPAKPVSLALRAACSVSLFVGVTLAAQQGLGVQLGESALWMAALWGLASAPLLGTGARVVAPQLLGYGVAFFAAVMVVEHALAGLFVELAAPSARGLGVVALAGSLLVAIATIGLILPAVLRAAAPGWTGALYVHALNGLYVGPITDRWTQAIWTDESLNRPSPAPETPNLPIAARLELRSPS